MAALTSVSESQQGISVAAVAAAGGGDTFTNTGRTRLLIFNGSGGSITVTVITSGTEPKTGLAIADASVVIPSGEDHIVKPMPVSVYGTTVSITYSGVTSLTISVIEE